MNILILITSLFLNERNLNMTNQRKFQVTIIADVASSLSKKALESRLVVSLFDVETEKKVSDGDSNQLEVVDYELTEAVQLGEAKL